MLEVKNVSYAYKTKKDKTILNNVSATFEEGTQHADQPD